MFPTRLQSHNLHRLPTLCQRCRLVCQASYRWSPDRDGRRKRESLFDNAESTADDDDIATSSNRTNTATAPGAPANIQEPGSRQRQRQRRRRQDVGDEDVEDDGQRATGSSAAWQESDWGPAGPPQPPEEDAWGWAQESWVAGPDDGQQYGQNRDEQRERNGSPGASSSSSSSSSSSYKRASTPRASSSRDVQDDDYDDYDDDFYEDAEYEDYENDFDVTEPEIALLSPQELERVLPVVPFSAQADFFNGGAAQAVQRWGASLALTVLLSKAALLAATSLTWPLWWPWVQAASKNYGVRKQSGCAGLWRTQILSVESRGRPRVSFSRFGSGSDDDDEDDGDAAAPRTSRFSTMRTTRIVLGDVGGAQTELVLPFDARHDLLESGQAAELIVLSDSAGFEEFKAVKDVYLPESGLWLSEYPFVDRTEFLELSLEVEREAAAAAGGGNVGGFQQPPPPPPRW